MLRAVSASTQREPVVHVYLGTQAELIKTTPVIHRLLERGIHTRLIASGQQSQRFADLVAFFELPAAQAVHEPEEVDTLATMLRWSGQRVLAAAFQPNRVFDDVFGGQRGVCLVHGDTMSTLLGLIAARRCGLRVAHVEAGLGSGSLAHPFPEELIRRIVGQFADVLFAPDEAAVQRLHARGCRGTVVALPANTVQESLEFALERSERTPSRNQPFALVSIHRFENVYVPKRMATIVDLLQRAAKDTPLLWPLHPVTRNALQRHGLWTIIEANPRIEICELQSYPDFIRLLRDCAFVIADGGSLQEETHFLNRPCLLLRKRTERTAGIGSTACLAGYDARTVEHFLRERGSFRREALPASRKPSEVVADSIQDMLRE
jgi:UDP-N-acetylglucosamine 2-epimerase